MHTHAGSTLRNPATLTSDLFDLRINACRGPAIEYMCTKLGADSSSSFPFRARTQTQTNTETRTQRHTHKVTDDTDTRYTHARLCHVGLPTFPVSTVRPYVKTERLLNLLTGSPVRRENGNISEIAQDLRRCY